MTGYYDMHTHILPGVDDGARDLQETMEMLYQAYLEGIRHIVVTPHFALDSRNMPVRELMDKFEEVKRAALHTVPAMDFSLGNELMNSAGMVNALNEGRALTLGGTSYILVEFLPKDGYRKIYSSLHNYIMNGYIPIVAHVERYDALIRRTDRMDELIHLGVLFQMNTSSLMAGKRRRNASYHRMLLEEGYIHLLGSDCHRSDSRSPLMRGALQDLPGELLNSGVMQAVLSENPKKILADKYL